MLIFCDKRSCYNSKFKLELNGGDLVLKEQACHLHTLIGKQSSFNNVKKQLQNCIMQENTEIVSSLELGQPSGPNRPLSNVIYLVS